MCPVEQGFADSLARPGGNITGFTAYDGPLLGKWMQLLKQIAPSVTRVAVIFNPNTAPFATLFNPEIEAAAPSLGITVTLAPVHDDAGIEEAIAAQAREPGGGLIVTLWGRPPCAAAPASAGWSISASELVLATARAAAISSSVAELSSSSKASSIWSSSRTVRSERWP